MADITELLAVIVATKGFDIHKAFGRAVFPFGFITALITSGKRETTIHSLACSKEVGRSIFDMTYLYLRGGREVV